MYDLLEKKQNDFLIVLKEKFNYLLKTTFKKQQPVTIGICHKISSVCEIREPLGSLEKDQRSVLFMVTEILLSNLSPLAATLLWPHIK